ncbi:MAG: hypothetical protein JRH01_20290 [Deltaproteobacteria bacterium]|nr:hypothetical protein [Deltaproteobacteria bacterium]
MSRLSLAGCVVCVILALGCGQQDGAPTETAAEEAAASPTASGDPPAGVGSGAGGALQAHNRGRVVSATTVGGYTYLEVDVQGTRMWVASSPVQVQPGTEVGWGQFSVMKNFTSKSLNKTFDQILFVDRVVPVGAGQVAATGGKVLSVVSGGGYNYIQVDGTSGSLWIAAPISPVNAGNQITWSGGTTMRNFASPSLDRSFDEILFVGGVRVVE